MSQGEFPHSNLIEFYVILQKLEPPVQIYGQSYDKNLIDLSVDECYTQILIYFLQKQVNPFL